MSILTGNLNVKRQIYLSVLGGRVPGIEIDRHFAPLGCEPFNGNVDVGVDIILDPTLFRFGLGFIENTWYLKDKKDE